MNQPWMEEWFGRMMPLVESGRREFYTVVEQLLSAGRKQHRQD